MSAEAGLFVCDADQLVDGGRGVRFPVLVYGQPATGFVVRFGGKPYAYLNRCAHVPIELDWKEGDFFESSGLYLMCATHGAVYETLEEELDHFSVVERDGKIFWQPDQQIQAPM